MAAFFKTSTFCDKFMIYVLLIAERILLISKRHCWAYPETLVGNCEQYLKCVIRHARTRLERMFTSVTFDAFINTGNVPQATGATIIIHTVI